MSWTKKHRIWWAILAAPGLLFMGSMALMWSWNTLAVDLFYGPEMLFKHALAALLIITTVSAAFGLANRHATGQHRSSSKVE